MKYYYGYREHGNAIIVYAVLLLKIMFSALIEARRVRYGSKADGFPSPPPHSRDIVPGLDAYKPCTRSKVC